MGVNMNPKLSARLIRNGAMLNCSFMRPNFVMSSALLDAIQLKIFSLL
jgi:hypothetical protein